jgi:predicted dehydrogenase
MLGAGFIGRFYADALQGYRSKDKVVSIYARREESAKKFAADYNCAHWTTEMEEAIAHPDVDIVCISLPNNLHEAAVMMCCKHKKAVMTTKPLGRNSAEAKRMLIAVEEAGIFNGYLEDLVHWVVYYGRSPEKRILAHIVNGSGILNKQVVDVF